MVLCRGQAAGKLHYLSTPVTHSLRTNKITIGDAAEEGCVLEAYMSLYSSNQWRFEFIHQTHAQLLSQEIQMLSDRATMAVLYISIKWLVCKLTYKQK